jgi:hypothetical protein
MFLKAGCSIWRAEGFSCRLEVLHEGERLKYIAI